MQNPKGEGLSHAAVLFSHVIHRLTIFGCKSLPWRHQRTRFIQRGGGPLSSRDAPETEKERGATPLVSDAPETEKESKSTSSQPHHS